MIKKNVDLATPNQKNFVYNIIKKWLEITKEKELIGSSIYDYARCGYTEYYPYSSVYNYAKKVVLPYATKSKKDFSFFYLTKEEAGILIDAYKSGYLWDLATEYITKKNTKIKKQEEEADKLYQQKLLEKEAVKEAERKENEARLAYQKERNKSSYSFHSYFIKKLKN